MKPRDRQTDWQTHGIIDRNSPTSYAFDTANKWIKINEWRVCCQSEKVRYYRVRPVAMTVFKGIKQSLYHLTESSFANDKLYNSWNYKKLLLFSIHQHNTHRPNSCKRPRCLENCTRYLKDHRLALKQECCSLLLLDKTFPVCLCMYRLSAWIAANLS